MTFAIRGETPADQPAIARLIADAFRDAPHRDGNEHLIVAALRDAGRLTLSLVATEADTDGDAVVGHVAASPVAIADGSRGWYGLGPLAVRSDRRRRGLGAQLIDVALAGLRARDAAGAVVLGDPAYYRRFGFTARPGLVLPGVPASCFQGLAFAGSWPDGAVAYDEAFAVGE